MPAKRNESVPEPWPATVHMQMKSPWTFALPSAWITTLDCPVIVPLYVPLITSTTSEVMIVFPSAVRMLVSTCDATNVPLAEVGGVATAS
jgi:hypothetical protein